MGFAGQARSDRESPDSLEVHCVHLAPGSRPTIPQRRVHASMQRTSRQRRKGPLPARVLRCSIPPQEWHRHRIVQYHNSMETFFTPQELQQGETLAAYIVSTPGTCGWKPRIAGHRIRVQDVVFWHERSGYTIEEILARYPQLTCTEVQAALAYCDTHRQEIQQAIDAAAALVARLKSAIPSKHHAKLRQHDASPHTLPPGWKR